MDKLTADADEPDPDPDPAIGTAPGALPLPGGGEVNDGLLLLCCPNPDEPVGLVPPVAAAELPMTKDPGGELEPVPLIEPGEMMTPPGLPTPLPALLPTDPTSGEGEACGIASGVGISLPYSPFCFPALDSAQSPESIWMMVKVGYRDVRVSLVCL